MLLKRMSQVSTAMVFIKTTTKMKFIQVARATLKLREDYSKQHPLNTRFLGRAIIRAARELIVRPMNCSDLNLRAKATPQSTMVSRTRQSITSHAALRQGSAKTVSLTRATLKNALKQVFH